MKSLYSFEINRDGKTHKFMVAKPTRRQIEEAEIEYAAEYSRCIRKDILPTEILRNKYEESGGLMSKDEAKNLNKKYLKMNELTSEITKIKSGKTTKANLEKAEKLEEELVKVRKEIGQIEQENSAAFSNTADNKAQGKALVWYAVNLTMIENDKGQWEPYFKGEDFEEKEDYYYSMEDSEDLVYFEAIGIIGSVISVWQYNRTMNSEQIEKILKEFEIIKDDSKDKKDEKPKAEKAGKDEELNE